MAVAACCAGAAGCGGGPSKREPSGRDVAVIAASVADVVYQCQAAAAGFIAGPDREALKRDVDRLVTVTADVEADARFRFRGRAQPTTLRAQAQQAARSLRAGLRARAGEAIGRRARLKPAPRSRVRA